MSTGLMTLEHAAFVFQILAYLVLPGLVWLVRVYVGQRREVDALKHRMENEVDALKHRIEHLPDRESVHKIELAITKMQGHIESLTNTTKRIETYLLTAPAGASPAPGLSGAPMEGGRRS